MKPDSEIFEAMLTLLNDPSEDEIEALVDLLGIVAAQDARVYREEWLPHLRELFAGHYEFDTWEKFVRWGSCVPHGCATFSLDLTLPRTGFRDVVIQELCEDVIAGMHAAHVTAMRLRKPERLEHPILARLLSSPFTSLKSLHLEESGADRSDAIIALAGNEALGALESLTIQGIELRADAWRALVSSPHLKSLREVHALGACQDEEIARGALDAFEHAVSFGSLEALDLRYTRCASSESWKRFATSSIFGGLTRLRLDSSDFGEAGFEGIATSSSTTPFTQFTISWCHGVAPYFATFVRSPRFDGACELAIEGTSIGREGFRALLESDWIARQDRLDLSCCELTDEDLVALATCEHLAHIHHLDFSHGAITSRGIEALVKSPHLKKLITLNLAEAHIGASGAVMLAQCEALSSLTSLDLSNNRIRDEGARALLASPHLVEVCDLSLSGCELTEETAEALATACVMQSLAVLQLQENALGDAGAIALANASGLTELTFIDISYNRIGEAGALALYESRLCPDIIPPSYLGFNA